MADLLDRYRPIDEAIEGEIKAEASAERKRAEETKKLDGIDNEFRNFMGDKPEPPAEESDPEE